MGLESDIAFFEQVPTFAVLGKQALRVLAIGAETRHLQSGTVLYYAGDLADGGYLVQDGSLLLEPGMPSEGKEFIVGPGTLLGELALLTDMVCPMTATRRSRLWSSAFHAASSARCWKVIRGSAKKLRDVMASRIDSWTRELVAVKQTMD